MNLLFSWPTMDLEEFKTIIEHFDKHMAEGNVAAAMESLTKDSGKYTV